MQDTSANIFREASQVAVEFGALSTRSAEILLRTAELALCLGARTVWGEPYSLPYGLHSSSLVIENEVGERLHFGFGSRGYLLSTTAFGYDEHEDVLLYLRAVAIIQTHCQIHHTVKQIKD